MSDEAEAIIMMAWCPERMEWIPVACDSDGTLQVVEVAE